MLALLAGAAGVANRIGRMTAAAVREGAAVGKHLGPEIRGGAVARRPRSGSGTAEVHPLKRSLSALNLIALGVGGIIGAGIFILTGHAAAANAGPAVTLSFLLGAVACAIRRAVLRRDVVDRSDQRQRLYLCLCNLRRTDRLDHRLGPHSRICGRRDRGRDRLVRLCRQFCPGSWHRSAVAVRFGTAGL